MASSYAFHFFFQCYRMIWRLARPFLKRSSRLSDGWDERRALPGWLEPEFAPAVPGESGVDIWLQAASGGEARLAVSVCRSLRRDIPLNVLIVTWTRQGRDVLEQALPALAESHPLLRLAIRFAPFDHPEIARRAVEQARPRLLALLETEIWPGLLAACREQGVPVRIINGRINASTVKFAKFFPSLMSGLAPEGIRAVSEYDRRNFAAIFPCPVEEMPNIKFDLAADLLEEPLSDAPGFLQEGGPIFLFASVRQGEETRLPGELKRLVKAVPLARLVVVPRHLHRVEAWKSVLSDLGFAVCLRSELEQDQVPPAGTVLIWDVFGDLPKLYAAASAVFVGGSFGQGGQNFLESLAAGRVPCIGPSAHNFLWAMGGSAGHPSLEQAGLLKVARTPAEVMDIMLEQTASSSSREEVRERFHEWLEPRLGGSASAAAWLEEKIAVR